MNLSYFVAAHTVYSSGYRLQVTSQLAHLKIYNALEFANPLWGGSFFPLMCFTRG